MAIITFLYLYFFGVPHLATFIFFFIAYVIASIAYIHPVYGGIWTHDLLDVSLLPWPLDFLPGDHNISFQLIEKYHNWNPKNENWLKICFFAAQSYGSSFTWDVTNQDNSTPTFRKSTTRRWRPTSLEACATESSPSSATCARMWRLPTSGSWRNTTRANTKRIVW